jgi:hypothetical protein
MPPVRIGHHRLAADLVKSDILRGLAWRTGNRHGREHLVTIARRPFQHLHSAYRAADDAEQVLDPEPFDQHRLGPHHIADGDDRKFDAVGTHGRRIDRGRTSRAHASADDIGTNHEVAVRIDGLSRTHKRLPPAGFTSDRMCADDMLVAGQRMADHDSVRFRGVEAAIGLESDGKWRQRSAAIKRQRFILGKMRDSAQRLGRLRHRR